MAQNARYEDAAAGWSIFRRLDGNVSRPDLNVALNDLGHRSISSRTFTHYQKLQRLGYREYVSINRLDLRHSNRSVFNVADRSRYQDHPFQSAGTLLVPRGRDFHRFSGRITRVSEGFASLLVPIDSQALRVAKATKYKRGVLILESVNVERAVEVIEAQEVDGFIEVLLEFRSLLETDQLFPNIRVDTTTSRLHVNLGEQPPLSKVVEVVRRSFDLVESSRSILEATAAAQGPRTGPATATPRVRRLIVRNPVDVIIDIDEATLAVAGGVIAVVVAKFESLANGVAKLNETYVARQESKRAADLQPLRVGSFQMDVVKKGVDSLKVLSDIEPDALQRLGIDPKQITNQILPKVEPLKDQAIEAAAELQFNSDEPIEIGEAQELVGEDDEYEYYSYKDDEAEGEGG